MISEVVLRLVANAYFIGLQNGYSVLREACIGGHLELVRMLIEEYKCSLNHISAFPPDKCDFHRLDPSVNQRLKDEFFWYRLYFKAYLNRTFDNDTLKSYLMAVHDTRWKEFQNAEKQRTDVQRLKLNCRSSLLQSAMV